MFTLFAVRYAPGVSDAAAFASLRHDFGSAVLRQLPSEDVINLQSVDRFPTRCSRDSTYSWELRQWATPSSPRCADDGKDLAILKTLGFLRRQLMLVIGWQATSFSVFALLIGIPLGVVGGRSAWFLVA